MARSRRPRVVNGPLIKPREPGRFTDLARLVALGALLALPAFLYAGLQAQLLETRRSIVGLEERLEELDEQRRRLDAQLGTLRDPRFIAEQARLTDMEPPDQDQIVFLTDPFPAAADPSLVAGAIGGDDGRRRP